MCDRCVVDVWLVLQYHYLATNNMSSRKSIQKEEGEMRTKWLLNTTLQKIPILVTVEEIIKMKGKKLFCPNCQEYRSLEVIQHELVQYASCIQCSMVLLEADKRERRYHVIGSSIKRRDYDV